MKKNSVCLFFLFTILKSSLLIGQDHKISFTTLGSVDYPDSVLVKNKDQQTHLMLQGIDTLQLVSVLSGLNISSYPSKGLKCYPNPMLEQAIVEINHPINTDVNLQLCDIKGSLLIQRKLQLVRGCNQYLLRGLDRGMYVIRINDGSDPNSLLIFSQMESKQRPEIYRIDASSAKETVFKGTGKSGNLVEMQYNQGDILDFTAYLNQDTSTILSLMPDSSMLLEFYFATPPVVNFKASTSNPFLGTTVHFSDTSANHPDSWLWDFGDGTTSTLQNPSYIYKDTGTFTVTLTASNGAGSNKLSKTAYITVSKDWVYGFKDNGLYGLINANGTIISDSLTEGYIGSIGRQYVLRYYITYEVIPPGFLPTPVLTWKCYHRDGRVVDVPGDYGPLGEWIRGVSDGYAFYEGRAIVARKKSGENSLHGFVDEDFNEIIPCQYRWVSRFENGLAAVLDPVTYKIGYIDKRGQSVIDPQFDAVSSLDYVFHEGKAVVRKNDIYYVIDTLNNIVTDFSDLQTEYPDFTPVAGVSEGLICIFTGKYGYANLEGRWEIDPISTDSKPSDFIRGFATISNINDYGHYMYINRTGSQAFPGVFYSSASFDENNLVWVIDYAEGSRLINSTGTFIDTLGNVAFPGDFQGYPTSSFVNGLALLKDVHTDEWRYMNPSGDTVLTSPGKPYIYTSQGGITKTIMHGNFSPEGVALIIFQDDTYGYINLEGTILWRSQDSYLTLENELRLL